MVTPKVQLHSILHGQVLNNVHIKEECLVEGPKAIVSSISDKFGGIIGATGPGELPRNEKQISNFKRKISFESRSSKLPTQHNSSVDDLFTVMQQAYSDDPLHRFVRAVNAAPEPAIVVATNSQLQNLVRFCTSSFEFSVMTIDPTFSLGEFDVTLTTFRHLFLQSKRYKQPSVFVGPACIHFKKTFSTYLFFASTLIGQCRDLESVRVIGTDGEIALIDAFKHEFGYAQHLTCFIHVRRNIKMKLQECNIPSQISIDILNDILGNKIGTTYVEGLVDSHNTSDFDTKLEKLVTKWQNSEVTSKSNMDHFIDWFQSHKAPVIRSSMIRDVREESGLGSPPIPFTTNASETANYMLKNKVNYKKNELPEFLQKYRELVNDQEREVELAVINRGNYELRSQYKSWHISETKWFTMSTTQRKQHLMKFSQASLSDIQHMDVGNADGDDGPSNASITLGRDVSLSSVLSVSLDSFSNDVRVPRNSLEGIWNKASEILKTKDSIVPAPGITNAKFVLSYSGSKPHLVVPKQSSIFACDSECPNWKGMRICAHSVAVAEMSKQLPEYIEKFKKSKITPNVSKFAQATMPKGRGRKGSVCPRKRKSSHAIQTRLENPSLAASTDQEECPTEPSTEPEYNTISSPFNVTSSDPQFNSTPSPQAPYNFSQMYLPAYYSYPQGPVYPNSFSAGSPAFHQQFPHHLSPLYIMQNCWQYQHMCRLS